MFKSIFKRLFFAYAAILVIMFLIVSVAASILVDRYTVEKQKETVLSISETIEYWTATYQIEQSNIRADAAYQQVLKSWAEFAKADIVVASFDGEINSSTASITTVPAEYMDIIRENELLIKKGTFGNEYDERHLTVGVPIKYYGTTVAAMFFNTPLKFLTDTTFDIVIIVILCTLISIIIASVALYIQSKRFSKTISEINNAARNIAAGNFGNKIAVTTKDEIGQLASSFNFMADSIEDLENMRASFISDVSHELRTPMTSISGFAQSILDGTIPEEKRNDYLKIIVDESRRLTKLVNDMLEMSKMSSSEYQLSIEKFDLNELMRICIISLESIITDKGLDLNVEFDRDSLMVLGDKDSIKRVILNLMDNAIKFSYSNTTIGINTWVKGKKAYLSIGNFGDGIDQKDLSSVFNRFYKTDKSRRYEKSGAGLGLSLCKNIITLHKQNIWVESNIAKEGSNAKYTKFTFTLEAE